MSESPESDRDIVALRADLSLLQNDFDSLVVHVKGTAQSQVVTVADRIQARVRRLSPAAALEARRSAKAAATWAVRQPLAAFLVAAGVGFLGVRALLR